MPEAARIPASQYPIKAVHRRWCRQTGRQAGRQAGRQVGRQAGVLVGGRMKQERSGKMKHMVEYVCVEEEHVCVEGA